ncbi:MAG TPA: hypothetical protein VHI31_01900 [Actinomycetota bacterium]|nr:hypothetical protein [Actinomycetota bacterium]
MATDVELELDDFLRWLATMPHHLVEFKRDPEHVMRYAKLSDMAIGTLRSMGKEEALERIRNKKEEILNAPEAKEQSTFARDFSAQGYGGTVVKKEQPDGE